MASEFLVDGDLFVEVVDNTDGGGFPPNASKRLAKHTGTAVLIVLLFHSSVPTVITVCVSSTVEGDLKRTSFVLDGAAASISSSFLTFQAQR